MRVIQLVLNFILHYLSLLIIFAINIAFLYSNKDLFWFGANFTWRKISNKYKMKQIEQNLLEL